MEIEIRGKRLVAIFACATLISCGDNNTFVLKPRDFEKPVPSGLRAIPQTRQMEELFGPAIHAIRNLREDQVTAEWETTVLFGGRYELSMKVPVRMTADFGEIKEVLGDPDFKLLEVSAITDEGRGAMYDPEGGRHLSADDWAKIYRAKGDFSAVGITLKKNPPVRDFDKHRKSLLQLDRERPLAPLDGKMSTDVRVVISPDFVQIGLVGFFGRLMAALSFRHLSRCRGALEWASSSSE